MASMKTEKSVAESSNKAKVSPKKKQKVESKEAHRSRHESSEEDDKSFGFNRKTSANTGKSNAESSNDTKGDSKKKQKVKSTNNDSEELYNSELEFSGKKGVEDNRNFGFNRVSSEIEKSEKSGGASSKEKRVSNNKSGSAGEGRQASGKNEKKKSVGEAESQESFRTARESLSLSDLEFGKSKFTFSLESAKSITENLIKAKKKHLYNLTQSCEDPVYEGHEVVAPKKKKKKKHKHSDFE